ncbi:MAG: helix-hairpin-helix domain-containing protein [Chitinophagaceae bacterium]|nr:helix-hairpin-helix domain-containing protein [Chitinophagaceae bacterium]
MLKNYFTFTRNQSRAILTLMAGSLTCTVCYFLMPYFFKEEIARPNAELQQMMKLIHTDEKQSSEQYFSDKNGEPQKLTPFNFDPNTLDSAGFKKLGLRDKLVRTLMNYRHKGGRFYNNESLRRIYGLHEDEYNQLEPYIRIAGAASHFERKAANQIHVELNSADTAQLVRLRGIGSKLSMNIVQYRKKLGGFTSAEQLREVWGISAETYDVIKPCISINKALIIKIKLNEATLAEMNLHPYLKGEIARAIVDLRKKNGYHLSDLAQLKEIDLINEEIFRKIAPYLTIQ